MSKQPNHVPAARKSTNRECSQCGGTGRLWLYRTIYPVDGFHLEECKHCSGSGKSFRSGIQGSWESAIIQRERRAWFGLALTTGQDPHGSISPESRRGQPDAVEG